MNSNIDYIVGTLQTALLFIVVFIISMSHKVKIENLENIVSQQQVKIENQALDIMILKSNKKQTSD